MNETNLNTTPVVSSIKYLMEAGANFSTDDVGYINAYIAEPEVRIVANVAVIGGLVPSTTGDDAYPLDEIGLSRIVMANRRHSSEEDIELVKKVHAGKAGKYALLLDIYEHSTVTVHLPGELIGGYCWDTSSKSAAWVPSPELARTIGREVSALVKELGMTRADAEQQVAKTYCRKELEVFNAWNNGEVYGVCVYAVDIETGEIRDEDECWGYIGYQYATDALTQCMELTSNQYCRQ